MNVFQTLKGAGQRHPAYSVSNGDRRPHAVFIKSKNPPVDVDAPLLRRRLGESESLERNLELRNPAFVVSGYLDVPCAVPVIAIGTVVGYLRVAPGARGIGAELKSRSPIVKTIDDDADAVGSSEIEVFPQVIDNHPACLRIKQMTPI